MTRSMVRSRPGESVEGSAEAYDYRRYEGYQRGTVNLSAPGAHGLYANIENMATWLIGLDAVASSETRPQDALLDSGVLNDGTPVPYVHGMHWDESNGLVRWHADGTWQGFNSAMQYFPEERFGVVILCNWISGWVNPVSQCNEIANLFLAVETEAQGDNETPADTSSADTSEPDFTPDPSRYDQLLGDYRWEPGDVFGIGLQEGRLTYQMPNFSIPMNELTEDHFVLDGYPYYFTFHRDEQGRAASCLIEHEGDADVTALRIELADPGPAELEQLAGDYFSPELNAEYSVEVIDGSLFLSHRRLGRTQLEPEAADHFTCRSPAFRLLEFLRDDQGQVSGFEVNTMNVVFRRRS
jgi:hypothetical protein